MWNLWNKVEEIMLVKALFAKHFITNSKNSEQNSQFLALVGNSLLLFIVIFGIVAVAESAVMTAMAFVFIISFCGIFMGVILLKGANQQRVSFLRAWLIYGVTAVVVTIIAIILNATGSSHPSTLGTAVFSGMLGLGVNVFSIVCVFIHMREINEGVFIP